jgi:hypothetical protein
MNRTISGVAALLAVAATVAGCGGGTSASGTTSGDAGMHHAHGSGTFRASVHGFEAELQTSVHAFQKGNIASAAATAGPLLANCMSTVNNKLAPHAATTTQKQAVVHLRLSCSNMEKAVHTGMSGNLKKAKEYARAALEQSQIAAQMSG